MNENDIEKLISVFRSNYELGVQFGTYIKYNEQTFDKLLAQAKTAFPELNVTPEEEVSLKKRVDSIFQIYQPDSDIILDDYEHNVDWYSNKKSEIEDVYWRRYRAYLFNRGWETAVLDTLEKNSLEKMMNNLGDPLASEHFSRRGLVMGDVQSGKTSNYIGLMCKAADASYKVIILLTGTIENLRKQTQIRVEEGFIGYDTANQKWVGVGINRLNASIPKSTTSRDRDFTGVTGENTMLRFSDDKVPFIFITKKNVNTLKKIRESIANLNLIPPASKIDTSLLIIDDESDNASVNTNVADYDPTRINSEIRKLLNLFTKSNYVGFTATPFANVFIDPDSETEMLKGDLFPTNFILSLNPPSNYFGPKKMFLDKTYDVVRLIQDHNESFPLSHKKEWDGTTIFPSLIEAINSFLIVNVIRDLNETINKNSHRTMLINVSRFIKVQEKFLGLVERRLYDIITSIKYSNISDFYEPIQNPYIRDLHFAYEENYKEYISWDELIRLLYDSIKDIKVFKVPNRAKDPNYEKNVENGLRCIVIGGLSLSRGLTLEGLTVSYLYRNTATFDVLMQMGRWFGFRDKPANYAHLCKVWMLEKTEKYFLEITKSIEQLKQDIRELSESKMTPREFGIRVRNESDELGITDRNKMRSTKKYVYTEDLFGKVLETPYINSNDDVIRHNFKIIEKLIGEKDGVKFDGKILFKSIPVAEIVEFLESVDIHEANRITYFETVEISKFIKDYKFTEFDIMLLGLQKGNPVQIGKHVINLAERSFDLLNDEVIRFSGTHRRVGGRHDTRLPEQKLVDKGTNSSYLNEGRNPVLLIYPISLKKQDVKIVNPLIKEYHAVNALVDHFKQNKLIPFGIGIGFPHHSEYYGSQKKVYFINDRTKWWNIMHKKDNEDDE